MLIQWVRIYKKAQISSIYKPNAMMSLIPIETEGLESEDK